MTEIIVRLDVMLARRKMRSRDLAEAVGITEANISLLKSGKVKGIRFDTLARICAVLECQPGDLLEAAQSHPAPCTINGGG
jgi:putative transcriptional regulator